MDHDNDKLLRIGTFSLLTRISVRMLRHYHEREVLAPERVDPFTGHRFYRTEQIRNAREVVQLRDAGFPVEQIAQLLKSRDPARVNAAIDIRRQEISRQRGELDTQLAALDRINISPEGHPDMVDVSITQLPPMVTATLRRIIPTYSDEGLLWNEIMPLMQQCGAFPAPDGLVGATYYDPEFKESDVDVEIWIQVQEPFTAVAPLGCHTEPGRQAVTATLKGDYSQIPTFTSAIGEYITEHQLEAGPMFNIYRVGPPRVQDPENWITDVCFPVLNGVPA